MPRKTTVAEPNPTAQVETVSLDDLTLDPANLRKRDDRANRTLEASLKRFGPARSLVVDGNNIVRAGNGTLEAAHRAGVTSVLLVTPEPGQLVAVKRGDWIPSEATAYGIADNRTTDLGSFDEQPLAETLRALQSEDFDLEAVGYTDGEIDELIKRLGDQALASEPESETGGNGTIPERFEIVVECSDEASQRQAFEKLQAEGYKCRVLTL